MTEISIVTENGQKFAKVPLADYRAMEETIEATSDATAILSASRDPKDYIPLEIAKCVLDGENPVKAWREHRGLTQSALAASAGIARAYLSQLETGKRDMSVSTLQHLAEVLNTDISFLLVP